jgi:hypothetical protein
MLETSTGELSYRSTIGGYPQGARKYKTLEESVKINLAKGPLSLG